MGCCFSECLLDAGHPVSNVQSREDHSLERFSHSPRVKQLGVRPRLQVHGVGGGVMISQREVRSLRVHFTGGKTESLIQGWREAKLGL